MVDAGCQCVYVVDSAGALIMEQTADRVSALVAEIGSQADVGFHGHEATSASGSPTPSSPPVPGRPDRRVRPPLRRRRRQHATGGVHRGLRQGSAGPRGRLPAGGRRLRTSSSRRCRRVPAGRMTLMMDYAGVYSSFLKARRQRGRPLRRLGRERSCSRPATESSSVARDQLIDIALMLRRNNGTRGGPTLRAAGPVRHLGSRARAPFAPCRGAGSPAHAGSHEVRSGVVRATLCVPTAPDRRRGLDGLGRAVIATDPAVRSSLNAAAGTSTAGRPQVIGEERRQITMPQLAQVQTAAEEIVEALRRGKTWSGGFAVQQRDDEVIHALVTDAGSTRR